VIDLANAESIHWFEELLTGITSSPDSLGGCFVNESQLAWANLVIKLLTDFHAY
jgi:hypothetical protein